MEKGSLKCFGTPSQLKQKYGLGYLLTLAVNEASVDKVQLNNLIRSHLHNTQVLTSVGSEIIYSLPKNETQKFELLFKTIETNLDKLGVLTFGISVSSIEEVFLRCANVSV